MGQFGSTGRGSWEEKVVVVVVVIAVEGSKEDGAQAG